MNLSYKSISSSRFLPKVVKDFVKNSKAVAAVEFALIAPLLILLFIGTVEISLLVAVDRKLSRTSSAVADLITQQETINGDELENVFGVTDRIMFPYTDRIPCVVVTFISTDFTDPNDEDSPLISTVTRSVDNSGQSPFYTSPPDGQCVKSSASLGENENARQKRIVGSDFPLPAAIQVAGSDIVVAEVEYDHRPIVGFISTRGVSGVDVDSSSITLGDRIYLRPRFAN